MSICEPCLISSKQVSATYVCQECDERYCQSCKQDHNKFKALRGHNIESIETHFGTAECVESYKDYERTQGNHDSANVVALTQRDEIACASDEIKEYDYADLHDEEGASNHFYIDVEDTDISRRMGIDKKQCLLLIQPNTYSLSIAINSVELFTSSFKRVRRYGIVSKPRNEYYIEFGRACQFGEGYLSFRCNDSLLLHDCIMKATKRYTATHSVKHKMSTCEPCLISSKQASATHVCQECNERYCPSCKEDHNKFKALRGHKIESIKTQFGSAEYDEKNEDYEEVEHSSDSVDTMKQNDEIVCASDEYKHYDYPDLHGEEGAANHFYIDVDDTELSRRICIDKKQCLLVIDPNAFMVSVMHNSVRKFQFSLTFVRKYGIISKKRDEFSFTLGRKCQFGEGELSFKCKDVRSLHDFISKLIKHYVKQSAASPDKQS